RVWLEGPLHPQLGWVMDFAELKAVVRPVVDRLDHKCLNNIPGLTNPTCERIAVYIWDNIKPALPLLVKVELHETPTSGVVYAG
ncbi:MAG: 6-carboxytetrahydropterin synthase, partial [Flavihumibacter sp.]